MHIWDILRTSSAQTPVADPTMGLHFTSFTDLISVDRAVGVVCPTWMQAKRRCPICRGFKNSIKLSVIYYHHDKIFPPLCLLSHRGIPLVAVTDVHPNLTQPWVPFLPIWRAGRTSRLTRLRRTSTKPPAQFRRKVTLLGTIYSQEIVQLL